MNVIIEIYIFICIMLLLFDILFLIFKNFRSYKFYFKKNKFIEQLHNKLSEYDPNIGLENKFKTLIIKKIRTTKNLIALYNELEKIEKYEEEIYSEMRHIIIAQLDNYKKKSNYEQAYYCYVISKLGIKEKDVDDKFYSDFLTFLDSSSLYIFTNTMNAIYHFENVYIMVLAIDKVNERNGFYHSKLFIDGLLEFSGDCSLLHKTILEKFNKYEPLTQESLLNYFRMKEVDIKEFCINLLKDNKIDSQVLYAVIRYLSKYPCESSKKIFIEIIQNDESFWIEQMLAIQALSKYDDLDSIKMIEKKVTDRNWYIRTAAIEYLHCKHINKDEIFNILYLKDKYANEALLYWYKNDKEMTRYIVNTIQILNQGLCGSRYLELNDELATV